MILHSGCCLRMRSCWYTLNDVLLALSENLRGCVRPLAAVNKGRKYLIFALTTEARCLFFTLLGWKTFVSSVCVAVSLVVYRALTLTARPRRPPWLSCRSCTWPRGWWRARQAGWRSFYSAAATFPLRGCRWIWTGHENRNRSSEVREFGRSESQFELHTKKQNKIKSGRNKIHSQKLASCLKFLPCSPWLSRS